MSSSTPNWPPPPPYQTPPPTLLPSLSLPPALLSQIRTLIYSASRNGEHVANIILSPSSPTLTLSPTLSPLSSHLTIPLYAHLHDRLPPLKPVFSDITTHSVLHMVASCRQYPATPIFHVRIPDIRYSLHEETALGESVYELERNSLSILLQTYNNPDQIGLLQTAFSYKTTLRAVKLSELTSLPTGAWVVGDERAVCAGLIALGRAFRRRVNGRLSKSSAVNGRVFRIVVIRFVGSDVRIREGWLGVGTEEAVWQGNVGTLGDVQWRRVQSIGVTRGISSVRADVDETRVRGERWGGEMRMLNERRVRDGRSRVVDRRERTERGSLGELDRRRSEGRSDVGGVREGDEQVRERDSGDRHEPVYLTARMAEFDFGETRRVSECESVVTRSAESEEESDDELEAVCRRHLGRGYREEVDRVLRRMN